MSNDVELKVGQRWVHKVGQRWVHYTADDEPACDETITEIRAGLVHSCEDSGFKRFRSPPEFRESFSRLRRDDELPGYVAPKPTEIAYHGEVSGLLRLDDRPGLVGVAIHMNIGTEPVIVEVPFADAPRLGDRCRIVFVR